MRKDLYYAAFAVTLILVQALVLYIFGQPFLCVCGVLKFWEGDIFGVGNSQHFSDWYSFSHVIHGFLFYFFAWILFPKAPALKRLLLAIGMEMAWEILENTPWVINKYREQALAQGYIGDSIINSISDSLMMVFGFVLAWRFPVWSIVLLALAFELFTGWAVHDNLTLNILNFIHPFEFITQWQSQA
jgi:hypothetical protein